MMQPPPSNKSPPGGRNSFFASNTSRGAGSGIFSSAARNSRSSTNNSIVLSPSQHNASLTWDAASTATELKSAVQVLSERCLKLSSKWAAEQWIGLPPDVVETSESFPDSNVFRLDAETNPMVYYAKSLLELSEYSHAAAVLSQTSLINKFANTEAMPDPQPNLSPAAIYYRAYSLYLAGERLKSERIEQQQQGNSNGSNNTAAASAAANGMGGSGSRSGLNGGGSLGISNPYLQQLRFELLDAYEHDNLDAFGLHVYGMVLLQCTPPSSDSTQPTATQVLMLSIQQFPCNWSAWLDLASCCSTSPIHGTAADTELEIQKVLQPELSGHFMYHFFCAHLSAERQDHAEAKEIYERWMDPTLFNGSPYLLGQHAVCSYHTREFGQAKTLLEDLHHHNPYRLDVMDVYSNILYVQEDSVALSQLAQSAVQVDKYRAETCVIVGNYYSLKNQRAKAIRYFQRALLMDKTFTSAYTLMGHEYVEWKQTANAMECYRQAVQITPDDFRAWYGLGQTYELLNMNLYALYYYKQAAQLRPYDARMWCALGMTYAVLKRVSDAIHCYERAISQDESEGVATQKLAALYRENDQTEKAAHCYLRHLEIRYKASHPNMEVDNLEQMLQQVHVEATEAEAILFLADYHRDHGKHNYAQVFCSRLLDYPGQEREQAKAMLRELRSGAHASFTPGGGRRIISSSARPDGEDPTSGSGTPRAGGGTSGLDFELSP